MHTDFINKAIFIKNILVMSLPAFNSTKNLENSQIYNKGQYLIFSSICSHSSVIDYNILFYKNYNVLLLSTIYTAMKQYISLILFVMHRIYMLFNVYCHYIHVIFKYQKSTIYYSLILICILHKFYKEGQVTDCY